MTSTEDSLYHLKSVENTMTSMTIRLERVFSAELTQTAYRATGIVVGSADERLIITMGPNPDFPQLLLVAFYSVDFNFNCALHISLVHKSYLPIAQNNSRQVSSQFESSSSEINSPLQFTFKMRLSTLVIVPVIASAACAMPVENVPPGQGDSSLSSSDGEHSQVLAGPLHPRWSLWGSGSTTPPSTDPGQQISSNGHTDSQQPPSSSPEQKTRLDVHKQQPATIPLDYIFCTRPRGTCSKAEDNELEIVRFTSWVAQYALDYLYEQSPLTKGQGIKVKLKEQGYKGLTISVPDAPNFGHLILRVYLYRDGQGGVMVIEAHNGKDTKEDELRKGLSVYLKGVKKTGWEDQLPTAQRVKRYWPEWTHQS
ncbi:hypothetical protein F5880DRAFT_1512316 [Lentinula raphanica]|nr:hypothetical protein F5880DRAFT_1512316 [Lentinula raphanica]